MRACLVASDRNLLSRIVYTDGNDKFVRRVNITIIAARWVFPHRFLGEFLHSLALSANKYSIQLKLFAGETGFNFTCFVFSAVLSSVKPLMCLFHRITRALGGVAVDLVFNVARGRLYTVYSRFENRSGTKLAKTTGGSRTQSERRKPTKLRWLRDRCRIPRAAGCPLSEVPFAKHPQSVRIVRASRSEMQCSLVIAEATTPRGVPIDCFPGPAMIGERWRRCWDPLLSLFSFSLLLSPACFSLSLSRSPSIPAGFAASLLTLSSRHSNSRYWAG